jgi:hypothetical protein
VSYSLAPYQDIYVKKLARNMHPGPAKTKQKTYVENARITK